MHQKSVAQGIGMAVMAALLAGCSEHAAEMEVGDLHHTPKTPLRSAVIQGLVSQDGRFVSTTTPTLQSTCTVAFPTTNSCAAYYNEKYTGPGAAYAYATQKGMAQQAAQTLMSVTGSDLHAQLLAGDGLGAAAAIGGSSLGPMGIAASFLVGGSGSSNTVHGQIAMTDYNHQVQLFNAGKLFWVARYYPTQQWQIGLNESSRLAIALADDLRPATWASGTSGAHLYRLHDGWWVDLQDGMFEWAWTTGKPKAKPAVLPIRLTWIVQPWHKSKQPFYIVNKKKVEYPFMALATIEYRIQPRFDIPQWISAHSTQLAGWMVIYRQGDKAVVWKNGQTVSYAPPMPMAIRAKPKAK